MPKAHIPPCQAAGGNEAKTFCRRGGRPRPPGLPTIRRERTCALDVPKGSPWGELDFRRKAERLRGATLIANRYSQITTLVERVMKTLIAKGFCVELIAQSPYSALPSRGAATRQKPFAVGADDSGRPPLPKGRGRKRKIN